MPLTQEQENLEHELRIETMTIGIEQARANIEQMRANVEQMRISADQMRANIDQMRANSDKLRNDVRYESRKFAAQALVAAAACVGAGIALANWVNNRPNQPPAVQTAPPQTTPRG